MLSPEVFLSSADGTVLSCPHDGCGACPVPTGEFGRTNGLL